MSSKSPRIWWDPAKNGGDGAGAELIELEDGTTDKEEKASVLCVIFLDAVVAGAGIGPRRGCSAATSSTSAAVPCSVCCCLTQIATS